MVLLFISSVAISQTASAIFTGNKAFKITINNVKQHNNYTKSLIVYKLSGNQPYNITIDFKNDSNFVKQNIYLIDEGLAHIYNVSKDKIELKKVIPSASYNKTENILAIAYIENAYFQIDSIKTDTIDTNDTNYVVPFASYYNLKDYNGKIGCPFPIKEEEKAELRGLIIAETLEDSKLEKAKTTIQEMDSACVLIDHIKELALLFEYEETRLDFTKFMVPFTFDIDNYEKLYPLFNFDNSKDELKKLFNKKD